MVTVVVFKNKQNQITRFTVNGHAGFAESGSDIVCAAVTTTAMTAVNGLTDVAGIAMEPQVASGHIDCVLPAVLTQQERHDADVLLDSMMLTFDNLADLYADYICIKTKTE